MNPFVYTSTKPLQTETQDNWDQILPKNQSYFFSPAFPTCCPSFIIHRGLGLETSYEPICLYVHQTIANGNTIQLKTNITLKLVIFLFTCFSNLLSILHNPSWIRIRDFI